MSLLASKGVQKGLEATHPSMSGHTHQPTSDAPCHSSFPLWLPLARSP